MGIENLERIFHPRSIAVVGANEREGSPGAAILDNLMAGGYAGGIYPVNPVVSQARGMATAPTLSDLAGVPDLAVIATPIEAVAGIVAECARLGVGGAMILSAGGREIGAAGLKVEEEISRAAAGSDLRLVGPNCAGIVSAHARLNASFAARMPLQGKAAFISQSGSIFTAILDISLKERIGFSYYVGLGGMIDVNMGDVIDYLGSDYRVNGILIYMEHLSRFRNFMSAARAVSRIKPIIVLKAGRTASGRAAAATHTGAMAGDDAVYDAAFERAGILRVKTLEEFFDCAELLAKTPRPSRPDLAIVTNAGGPGVIAVDALADYGVGPAALSEETLDRLAAILPPYWSRSNPVDILGNASPARYEQAVSACLAAPEAAGLLIMLAPSGLSRPEETAAALIEPLKKSGKPAITAWIGGPGVEAGRRIFNEAGLPTFDTPERAVRAFMDLYHHGRAMEMLQQIPPRLPDHLDFDREAVARIVGEALEAAPAPAPGERPVAILGEPEAKAALAAYGIPVNPTVVVAREKDVWRAAQQMGFPVVIKIHSPDIPRKAAVGCVKLDLATEIETYQAYGQIMGMARASHPEARLTGVTLQPMIKSVNCELILGARRDRDFGPVILFGMGGIASEIIADRALALPPLNRLLARRLMEKTRVYRMLTGECHFPPADLEKLEEILIRLSGLLVDRPEIEALDINPMMVADGRFLAVDARMVLSPSPRPAPLHFVISAYPDIHEETVTIGDGHKARVRPIRPEDAPLFSDMFASLSPKSVYYRFFSTIKVLRHEMLARFTQIDYDREMALVAIRGEGEAEEMLGVARIITERNGRQAEFAVLVRDAWQGKGVGAALLQRCLDIARDRKLEKVWGLVLPENKGMVALGKKLGFSVKRDPDSGDFMLTIVFPENP